MAIVNQIQKWSVKVFNPIMKSERQKNSNKCSEKMPLMDSFNEID